MNVPHIASTAIVCLLVAPNFSSADDSLDTFKALKPELAVDLAQITMHACREGGYQVAVAIVDRSGTVQVMLRDRLAGPHTLAAARRNFYRFNETARLKEARAQRCEPTNRNRIEGLDPPGRVSTR